MDWVSLSLSLSPSQIKEEILSPSQEQQQQPYYFRSPNPQSHASFTLNSSSSKVSPSILLLLVILAIIFFVSGLLHLLVRFLLRPQPRHPDDSDLDSSLTALQGQLQQLFHLHDAGVDQSFIDTLPVFPYKSIIIANANAAEKTPFDCAVCLCEFEVEDKLRLLPQCSHAFHMECIDTWLLSHSTCPLCRASLLPSTNPNPNPSFFSPVVLVLESGSSDSDTSREIVPETPNSVPSDQFGANLSHKSGEFVARTDPIEELKVVDGEDKEVVVPVKLGKFRNVDGGGGGGEGSSNGNVDERRCFSMGSFEYVMDQNSSLQVPIRTPLKKEKKQQQQPRSKQPLTPGHRVAMSECDCDSRREFTNFTDFEDGNANGGDCKRESFSMSRIWLREKKKTKKKVESSSRRAFSFRFPISAAGDEEEEGKKKGWSGGRRRTVSEIDMRMRRWEGDEEMEIQSCHSLESQPSSSSSARRTLLLWLVGRQQNKVVHSSSPSNPNV